MARKFTFPTIGGGGGGGGGSTIDVSRVAFVDKSGNDGTAAVGDPAKPFLTVQAALTAALTGSASEVHVGVGTFEGITLDGSQDLSAIIFTGRGYGLSFVGGVTVTGGGATLFFKSDLSLDFGDILLTASPGSASNPVSLNTVRCGQVVTTSADGAPTEDGSNAPPGYDGSMITAVDCIINGVVRTQAGAGGQANGGGSNGVGGAGAVILLTRCAAGNAEALGGAGNLGIGTPNTGGSGGNISAVGCTLGTISTAAGTGSGGEVNGGVQLQNCLYADVMSYSTYTDLGFNAPVGGIPDKLASALFVGPTRGAADGGDANSGIVGEYAASAVASGSAVSLTTATGKAVTSIGLTAGDWDVEGNINFISTGASVTARSGGIASSTGTIPSDGTEVMSGIAQITQTNVEGISLPRKRISLSTSATVFLNAKATFSTGTMTVYGSFSARRVR